MIISWKKPDNFDDGKNEASALCACMEQIQKNGLDKILIIVLKIHLH